MAWKNLVSLLPVLTNSGISLKIRGHAYNAFIHSVQLYASATCAAKVDDIHQLIRNDNPMVRWICPTKLCEKMSDQRTYKDISSIEDVIKYNHLCWFGNLHHMDEEKWPRKILNFKVNGTTLGVTQRKDGFTTLEVTCKL